VAVFVNVLAFSGATDVWFKGFAFSSDDVSFTVAAVTLVSLGANLKPPAGTWGVSEFDTFFSTADIRADVSLF